MFPEQVITRKLLSPNKTNKLLNLYRYDLGYVISYSENMLYTLSVIKQKRDIANKTATVLKPNKSLYKHGCDIPSRLPCLFRYEANK